MKQMHRTHQTIWVKLGIFMLLLMLPTPAFTAEKSVKELATLGNEAFDRGDFNKADSFYSEALEKEPEETALMYNKANVLHKIEKYDEALTLYQEALQKRPPRKILGSLYFNTGNTYREIALQKKEDETKKPIDILKERLVFLDRALDMYRKALESEREISIAEGNSLEKAGLFARQNWALTREVWAATLENIREIERKNLKLEDGIAELLQTQVSLLPQLEKAYLNSIDNDILNFNLKIMAEYQRDYREDILALKNMAAKEEEKIQTEIDNLKANQPQQPGSPSPPSQHPDTANDTELQNQLQTAVKLRDAVEQAAALDEWILDGLNRGTPLEAWQNITEMIGLLQDLSSFLKNADPALSTYFSLLSELGSTELLLQQAAQLSEIKGKTGQSQIAIQKRFNLAKSKNMAAGDALTKINFYLTQMQEALREEPEETKKSTASLGNDEETVLPSEQDIVDLEKIFQKAFAEVVLLCIDELLSKNKQLSEKISNANTAIEAETIPSFEEQNVKAAQSFAWYKHMQTPLDQSLASLIKNVDMLADRLDSSDNLKDINLQREAHLRQGPGANQMEMILFQLKNIQTFLEKKGDASSQNDQKGGLQVLTINISKQTTRVSTAWKNYESARSKDISRQNSVELAAAAHLFRRELLNTLLIFSPDLALSISFERSKNLHKNLTELLPLNTDNSDIVLKTYKLDLKQAQSLQKLLNQYFSDLEKSLASQDNKEQQEAYSAPLNRRKKAASLMQRFVEQGKVGSSLMQENRFQLTELLFKEMGGCIDKAQLAFQDQPDEGEKALHLALSLQKKLEAQSRFANEALTVNGNAKQVNGFLAASQEDINEIAQRGKEALEQTVGMAEIPTHGQSPQANPAQPGSGQIDPAQLKKAIEKVDAAQEQIQISSSFMAVGEFHNTFEKHQEIIALLQEALDLLKNKDEEKGDEKNEDKQEDGEQEKQEQNGEQGQNDQGGQGENKPQKPLELTASEARELLEQLNQQDEKQQEVKAAPGGKSFNTPRPW